MILDLLKKRYSVRDFQDKEVPQEIINYILEAGRLSPSGGNEQSWYFGVITHKELIEAITEAAYVQRWMTKAAFLIVLCTKIVDKDQGGRGVQKARFPRIRSRIEEMEEDIYNKLHMEEHQTKIPGTHMVLAALEHDIGSTWLSYFEVEKVAAVLNLPKGCLPSEIIAFGYPKGKKIPRKKKAMEEVVFYNKIN